MKFYYHRPDAAIAGMAELSLEQRGAYYSILDVLYSRDGVVPDDDRLVARMINVHWRTWKAVKRQLMAAGKLRVNFGLLEANGVSEELLRVSRLSQDQRKRASKRWQEFKKAKEINGAPYATADNATNNHNKKNSSTNSESEKGAAAAVDDVDNFGAIERPSTAERIGSDELGAIIRAKRWAD
jgi:uncharacterized protein YdaU (DUF1376 family)